MADCASKPSIQPQPRVWAPTSSAQFVGVPNHPYITRPGPFEKATVMTWVDAAGGQRPLVMPAGTEGRVGGEAFDQTAGKLKA